MQRSAAQCSAGQERAAKGPSSSVSVTFESLERYGMDLMEASCDMDFGGLVGFCGVIPHGGYKGMKREIGRWPSGAMIRGLELAS